MNLFSEYQKKICELLVYLEKKNSIIINVDLKNLSVKLPPSVFNADLSCNAAMVLAKANKTSPMKLGEKIKSELTLHFKEFKNITIEKPGFININFSSSFWENYLLKIIKFDSSYGSNKSKKKKYNIEFVSANPTGPLHVGHCRGAILGDVLSNLISFNGHKVTKEYYVNDSGSQIKNFINSVYFRIIEIKSKKKFPDDENLYPGDYIIDIAKKIIKTNIIKDFTDIDKIYKKLYVETLKYSMDIVKNDLKILGVKHDSFVYESNLIKDNVVKTVVKQLQKKEFIYKGSLKAPKGEINDKWKARSQLLFKSTLFGDDTDRALQKEDASWTYFASDIAYHFHKVERKFDVLINVLGADHAGYIKRIKAATKAVSNNKVNLICKVSQLVKLFKSGMPFKMSKRKGDYITVHDLIEEVGKDSVRFMMLNRSNDAELDFDFEKVTEKSKENPVFYVQYAYARINSIFRALNLNIDKKIIMNKDGYILNQNELNILKKIAEWPQCVEIATNKLEPHTVPFYLYELSTLFHSYWNLGKDNEEFRFVSKKINSKRLILLQALALVIKNGMFILGVSIPKEM